MAKVRLDVNIHQNTIEENKSILLKLRGRSNKIDNKTSEEWSKLFVKLNNNNNNNNNETYDNGKKRRRSAKTSVVARQDQTCVEPTYGPIQGFPSGYWWGIRMDCSRDQVHSPFDKDIQEGAFGVASICTSHLNTTNDVDLGTLLTFTGGEYTSGKLNDPLMHNYRHTIPLRLVRSYNLANEFAPKTGYRYDGLYIVLLSWIGVSSDLKKYYKFALGRLNCQEPPPWSLQSKRSSQRISSGLRSGNAKVGGCGSLRCHMYGCQTQEPVRKRKKINHDHQSPTATPINVSSVRLIKSPEVQRNLSGSTIVMRHVSKKCDVTGVGAGYGMNVHGIESPIQIGNLMLPCSPKPPACKLQNTNISIRTELYDSSPNPQQDMRKTTPMTFCRIYKTNHLPAARMISSHSTNTVGTMNLNAFGPCIKDKMNQESQIQSRSGIAKVSDTPSVNASNCALEATSTKDNFTIKTNSSTPISDVSNKNIPFEYNSINTIDHSKPESNEEITKLMTTVEEYSDNDSKNSERVVINSRRSSNTSSSSTDSLMKKLQLPEAVVTIETMTPEQLLNLIVKKRYNPTGKLLIGSIIGLPAENFTKSSENSSKSITNPSGDSHTNKNMESKAKKTSNTTKRNRKLKDKLYESRPKSAAISSKKIGNENIDRRMRFMRLKRSRVAKALAPIEDSNINRHENSTERLNKLHTNDKISQPFSKSTTIKKRRGELANLVIDANFPTKIRSHTLQTRTMSRRLRSPTIILRKRKEFKGFITNYTRVDLCKKSKRLKSGQKTKTSKNRHIQKKKREKTIDPAKSIKINRQINKEEKRKNSMSLKDDVNCGEIERPNSRMVDAMTQCSLQKETLAPIEEESHGDNCNSKSVKIEWIDLVDSDDDIKSEDDNNKSAKQIFYRDNKVKKFSDDSEILQKNSTKKKTTSTENSNVRSNTVNNKCLSINDAINSLSAFVPVNLPDGDLRVARLRSIGFKPIEPCFLHNNDTLRVCNKDCRSVVSRIKPTVIRRNVDEQYNKYTSEENNVVGYMDHELDYQDIEAEASGAQKRSEVICKRKYTKVQRRNSVKNSKPSQKTKRRLIEKSFEQRMDEDDVDLGGEISPWLGWNSYVTKR